MSEENKPDSNVKSTVDAVTGLVQAVPVYQDTLQPAAKQIGKSLETVAKTVNIALMPIKALVWGYEKIEEFISTRLSEKLKDIPEENITTPSPQVAGPAIEALRYTGHDENLRELFANLIATAMNKETIHKAHPGYVEVIKNLSSDEAILLRAFIKRTIYPLVDIQAKINDNAYTVKYSNYSMLADIINLERPDLIPAYLNNLCRLGILEIPATVHMTAPNIYDSLENDVRLNNIKKDIEKEGHAIHFERGCVRTTSFGSNFIQNVVAQN